MLGALRRLGVVSGQQISQATPAYTNMYDATQCLSSATRRVHAQHTSDYTTWTIHAVTATCFAAADAGGFHTPANRMRPVGRGPISPATSHDARQLMFLSAPKPRRVSLSICCFHMLSWLVGSSQIGLPAIVGCKQASCTVTVLTVPFNTMQVTRCRSLSSSASCRPRLSQRPARLRPASASATAPPPWPAGTWRRPLRRRQSPATAAGGM